MHFYIFKQFIEPTSGKTATIMNTNVKSGERARSPVNDPPSEKVLAATRELFSMANKYADMDSPMNEPQQGSNKIAAGDVTQLLSEFRSKRAKELEDAKAAKRQAMKDALLSTPLPEDSDDAHDLSGGAYDPKHYVSGTKDNKFYLEYTSPESAAATVDDAIEKHDNLICNTSNVNEKLDYEEKVSYSNRTSIII
mgnify:CR=1 FL=1